MKKLPNSRKNNFDIIEELSGSDNAKVYYVKKSTNKEFALKELYQKSTEKKLDLLMR